MFVKNLHVTHKKGKPFPCTECDYIYLSKISNVDIFYTYDIVILFLYSALSFKVIHIKYLVCVDLMHTENQCECTAHSWNLNTEYLQTDKEKTVLCIWIKLAVIYGKTQYVLTALFLYEILVNYVGSGYKISGKLEMQKNIHRYDIAFSVLLQCIIFNLNVYYNSINHMIRNNYQKSYCSLSFMCKNDKSIEWSECDYQFEKGNYLDMHFGIHGEEECYIRANAWGFLLKDYQVFMLILIIYKLSIRCHIGGHGSAVNFVFDSQILNLDKQVICYIIVKSVFCLIHYRIYKCWAPCCILLLDTYKGILMPGYPEVFLSIFGELKKCLLEMMRMLKIIEIALIKSQCS